jgi:outer membrane lipoprotein-sorting protein
MLARLDTAGAKFTSFQGDMERDDYTRIVRGDDISHGSTYVLKGKSGSEVGIKIDGKGAQTVLYKNGVARAYNPGLNCFNTYSAADHKGTFDTLLTLAFGTSGKQLSEAWHITDLGSDTLTVDGKPTPVEKLDLVPKDQGLKNNITHITLWTELDNAISPKVVIYAPTGDTKTATYSNIRLNKGVDTKPFDFKAKPCAK